MDFAEVLLMLLAFGSILFLAYITTRYIGAKTSRTMMSKHINVVETISLGTDKKLHLIKAGEQYLLISSTSKSVELISEIRLDGAEEFEKPETAAFQNVFDFKSIFDKYAGVYNNIVSLTKNNKTDNESSNNASDSNRQNFRSNLVRLKNITTGMVGSDRKNEDEITDEKKV